MNCSVADANGFIVVDGEADPDLRFGSLVQLLRYARIDMGIEIDIDLEALRNGEDGRSQSHWAQGTIRYGDDERGQLVYIKSSITGDESDDIRDYHSSSPTFPHESTADQFFDEAQFEAYRALGFHSADALFEKEGTRQENRRAARTAAAGSQQS